MVSTSHAAWCGLRSSILAVTAITFAIFYLLPAGDPALRFAGRAPTPELLATVRHNLGLDSRGTRSTSSSSGTIVTGDQYGWPGLGYSYGTNVPIRDKIIERLPRTLSLTSARPSSGSSLGVAIGVISAVRRRSVFDRVAMGFALFGVSAPVFWLGLMSLFIFWYKLDLTAGTGYVAITESARWVSHLIVPWTVLALLYAAIYARMTRGNLLDMLGEDYIRTARAKGLSERRVMFAHGLRASLAPIVTCRPRRRTARRWRRDHGERLQHRRPRLHGDRLRVPRRSPVHAGVVLVGTVAVVIMNLLVDIAYAFLDPRVRYVMAPEPLLDVRDLAIRFPTPDGIVNAVAGLSFTLRAARRSGSSASRARARASPASRSSACSTASARSIEGEMLFRGTGPARRPAGEMRDIRGKDIAMIFQDPFAWLHPMYRVGNQIAEAVRAHDDVPKDAAYGARHRGARRGRHPERAPPGG